MVKILFLRFKFFNLPNWLYVLLYRSDVVLILPWMYFHHVLSVFHQVS